MTQESSEGMVQDQVDAMFKMNVPPEYKTTQMPPNREQKEAEQQQQFERFELRLIDHFDPNHFNEEKTTKYRNAFPEQVNLALQRGDLNLEQAYKLQYGFIRLEQDSRKTPVRELYEKFQAQLKDQIRNVSLK